MLCIGFLLIGSFVSMGSVYASGGGAVIGGGANYAGSSLGGYGGQAPPFEGTNSWIFYKNTCNKKDKSNGDGGCKDEANWMLFTPDSDVYGNSNRNWIAPECYEHKDGGFWHFGNDAFSGWYSWQGYNYYGLLQYVQGLDDSWLGTWRDEDGVWHWYRYSADLASNGGKGYGHFYSYDYSGNKNDRHNWYNSSWQLTQKLYDNSVVKYVADHWEDSSDTEKDPAKSHNALTQYKQAYEYYYGEDYPYGNRFPKSNEKGAVWYFCWWPGMTEKATLKLHLKSGSKMLQKGYDSVSVDIGEKATTKAAPKTYTVGSKTYTFSKITGCDNSDANTTRKCTINKLNKDTNVYAYYIADVNLKAYAKCNDDSCAKEVEANGGNAIDLNDGNPIDSDSTTKGGDAEVYVGNFTKKGYRFDHWGSTSSAICDNKNKNDTKMCTVNKLTENRNVNAYYTKTKRSLTAYAVNTDGSYLNSEGEVVTKKSDASMDKDTQYYGDQASVGGSDLWSLSDYGFINWASAYDDIEDKDFVTTTKSSDSPHVSSSGRTYYINALKSNKSAYAVYKRKYTLSLRFVTDSGASLSSIEGCGKKSKKDFVGEKALLSREGCNPTEY